MQQLKKKIIITGKIKTLTGLHIGGTNNSMSVGGMDNAVVRNPITQEPYIPGSSLKGKMRSLTELSRAEIGGSPMGRDIKHTPTNNPDHLAAQLFGYTGHEKSVKGEDGKNKTIKMQQPSRVIVRDGNLLNAEILTNTELLYTEAKTEVVIDRITSAAMPRQIERVPAGAEFKLDIILNILNTDERADNEHELIQGLFNSLAMVQDDYLGGGGSRGSGQVEFVIEEVIEKNSDSYKESKMEGQDKTSEYREKYIPKSLG